MYAASKKALLLFLSEHRIEAFYAFAIDEDMLCMNSVEKMNEMSKLYPAQFKCHDEKEWKKLVMMNTAMWGYRNFYTLSDIDGYSTEYAAKHYYDVMINDERQDKTEYAIAIDSLINKTKDFICFRATHIY
jgi:hypothetical protein